MFKKLFGVLQKSEKLLMLPVAILPAAGILLGVGTALQNPTLLRMQYRHLVQTGFNWFEMFCRKRVELYLTTYRYCLPLVLPLV